MAWFKVDDAFHSSKPVLRIPRRYRAQAVGLWILAGTWSAQEESDGFIPEFALEDLCGTPAIAAQLVRAGLWLNVTGESQEGSTFSDDPGWKFKNWGKYQPTREQLEEIREKERKRKADYRLSQRDTKGTIAGQTEGHHAESKHPDPTRPDPLLKDSLSEVADATPRPEIDDLLDFLDAGIAYNGFKKPSRTKKNHDAIRLLLDRDGYKHEQVRWIIQWACNDEFWRPNILSASKLREKFPQLMAKAGVAKQSPAKIGFDGTLDPDAILGKDYWVPGTPPPDLTIQEEMAWKDERIEEHRAERLAEAQRRVVNE